MNPTPLTGSVPESSAASAGVTVPSAFLRTLAHELRNYIAPVQNANHLLRLRARAEPALQPVIDIVERQLTGMLRTLEAIGEADRARRGELELARAPTSVEALVQGALDATRPLHEGRARAVQVDIAPGLPQVDVDAERVRRALAAVLDNALRYSPRDAPVVVTAQRGGPASNAIAVRVRDEGPGLPAGLADRMHAPFDAPHVAGHGLGLGLPLARAVLQLHRGDLALSSGGAGTEVTLLLPVARSDSAGVEAPSAAQEHAAASPSAPGRRVLIADDSAAVRTSLADLLQEMGHEVRAAANGLEAVEIATTWQPEFVLLDVHMPRLNGFDAARRIRAAVPATRTRLVLMSGQDLDAATRSGAEAAGFDHCIDKGLAINELGDLLARGLPG